jgi:hypothetical protein
MKNSLFRNKTFISFHPKYGYWGTPNFQKTIYFKEYSKEISIFHDQFGNRKIDNNSYTPTSRPTILFLGGSHTWGAGLENHQTYPALVQEKSSYNCLNFGQCSVGLDQLVIVLIDQIRKIQPEHVVIELHPWVVHRVLRKSAIGFPKPYFKIEDNKISLKNISRLNHFELYRMFFSKYSAFEKALEEYAAEIDITNLNKNYDPLFMVWNQNYYKDMYRIIQFLLQTAKNLCKENKVELLIVLGPTQQELEFWPSTVNLIDPRIPRIRLREMLLSEKIKYLDLEPRFEVMRNAQDKGTYPDGHINQSGHQIFANSIIEKITSND